MALRKFLILRKLRSSCLEGRTVPIQPVVNFLTASKAGTHGRNGHRPFAGVTRIPTHVILSAQTSNTLCPLGDGVRIRRAPGEARSYIFAGWSGRRKA